MEKENFVIFNKNIATNLESALHKKRLSKTELAKQARVTRRIITTLASSSDLANPSVYTLSKVASILDVTIDQLIYGKNDSQEDHIILKYLKLTDKKSKNMIIASIKEAVKST